MKTKTSEAAKGKWRQIILSFGIDEKVLNGKHHPCPACGGTDRFRFDDRNGDGDYYCSGCGPGDGFKLLMEVTGQDFASLAKEIDGMVGNLKREEVFKPEINIERRRQILNRVWKGAANAHPVKYLESRGIDVTQLKLEWLKDVRYHPAMINKEFGEKEPGMVALIRNKNGKPISIHRTFFDSKQKKLLPPLEGVNGGAVRMGEGRKIVVGEGIETTLSGMEVFNCPGWACISANGMRELSVPGSVEHVVVLADNDRSFTGQAAAFDLAFRMGRAGKRVDVALPEEMDTDINDKVNFHLWSN